MSLVEKSFDILVSSDPEMGAVNRSAGGGRFSVSLDNTDGFGIPKDAKNVNLQVIAGELWYNTPNIILGENSKFEFKHNNTTTNVNLPTGLYSVTQLNSSIDREVQKATGQSGLFSIKADDAQGKIDLTIKNSGDAVDFGASGSFNDLLGFDPTTITATTGLQTFTGQRVARFSDLAYYLLQSNMADEGLQINGSYEGIVAKILIDTKPSSQLLYQPPNPSIIDVTDNLRGNKNRNYTFSLLTSKGFEVDTLGEYWSFQIRVSYSELVTYD